MLSDKLRQFLVVFTVVSVLVMNYLSQSLPFGGQTNGQVSDKYHTDFTPAGFAFSIWGLIYLGLTAFAVYQALPSQRTNPRFRAVGPLVILNGLLNCLWLPTFQNEYFLPSVLIILSMLFTAFGINLGLRLHKPLEPELAHHRVSDVPAAEKWIARAPFGLYFGWLTVASIANVSVWLTAIGWDGWGLDTQLWAQLLIVIGLFIGLFTFNRLRSFSYLIVFVWAFSAIAVEQQGNGSVSLVAGAAAVVAAIVWLVSLFRQSRVPATV